jgi:hypothetical protein
MAFSDRMGLTITDFGRTVIIDIKRGKPQWSKDKKKLTITYGDGATRKTRSK